MNEKNIDDLFVDEIEGLLFSEDYADSEDNASLISEIAHGAVPDGYDGPVGDSEEKNGGEKSPKENDKEAALCIDEVDEFFAKDFDAPAIESLRESLKARQKGWASAVNTAKTKPSREEKIATPVKQKSTLRDGFGSESLRYSVASLKGIESPFVDSKGMKFSVRSEFSLESRYDSEHACDETTASNVDMGTIITPKNPEKPKIIVGDGQCSDVRQNSEGKQKETKRLAQKKKKSKVSKKFKRIKVLKPLKKQKKTVGDNCGLKPLCDTEDICKKSKPPFEKAKITDFFKGPEKIKLPARAICEARQMRKKVEDFKETKYVSEKKEIEKVSVNSKKIQIPVKEKYNAESSRKISEVVKENKQSSADVEKVKPSTGLRMNRCENIAANAAVSTNNENAKKNSFLISSCQKSHEERFFDIDEYERKSKLDNNFFKTCKKECFNKVVQEKKSLFSVDEHVPSKWSCFDVLEKKSRISLVRDNENKSANDSMQINFNSKKEMF